MNARACLVLRQSAEYTIERAEALIAGMRAQGCEPFALSDAPLSCETVALLHDWPGWWSKMELFRPSLWEAGNLLYFDIDTVLRGPIDDLLAVARDTLLTDFYHPARRNSGVMLLTPEGRRAVWQQWVRRDPKLAMRAAGRLGDGAFISHAMGDRALRWQNIRPGRIVSYKVHVRPTGAVPGGASVVCFHGKPRPWELSPEQRHVILPAWTQES